MQKKKQLSRELVYFAISTLQNTPKNSHRNLRGYSLFDFDCAIVDCVRLKATTVQQLALTIAIGQIDVSHTGWNEEEDLIVLRYGLFYNVRLT